MQNHIILMRERLEKAFSPESLTVVDESDQHIGHAAHQGGGRHYAVIITAACLRTLPRVEAHRRIYALFQDVMPTPIHALRIVIAP